MIADHRRPLAADLGLEGVEEDAVPILERGIRREDGNHLRTIVARIGVVDLADGERLADGGAARELLDDRQFGRIDHRRSEEHTSELQSLMRISYAVFCLKKKIQ